MLGGGAGSIDHMIKTLRNNKLLLKRKRKYFKGKFSYREIREYYTIKFGKPLSKVEIEQAVLDEIRKELILAQRKRYFKVTILSLLLFFVLAVPIYFLFQLSFVEKQEVVRDIGYDESRNPYSDKNRGIEMIKLGLQNKAEGYYFLAIGNFEHALKIYPNNEKVEVLLAESYGLICKRSKQYCEKGLKFIQRMKIKHPENEVFKDYELKYFKGLKFK
ncbi:MAG: hypothetical protein CMP59_07960 [Flavobacteriales bacterium]|nr:hypothetical protein [Flavobacteriales bacterium]|tara:strand:- start:450 stop:1100 length:651 start_codon:yes stop_codon:yes gene_type:complete